jgi:hypothetical protein
MNLEKMSTFVYVFRTRVSLILIKLLSLKILFIIEDIERASIKKVSKMGISK